MNEENKNIELEAAENTAEEKTEVVAEEKPAAKKAPKSKKKFNMRSFKHGTMSVVLTVVFIAAVVVVNIIVNILSERFNTSADLSAAGIYSLQETTENYLNEQLGGEVTFTVLANEKEFESAGTHYKQINELLKKMEIESDKVFVKYLDLNQNPNYSSQFKGESLASNYIVVESEKTGRHRILTPGDYFSVIDEVASYDSSVIEQYIAYYGSYVISGSNIEQAAVSAMMYVSNDDLVRVAFTEGYGEEESRSLRELLTKNGYEVTTINLNTSEIDSSIDFIVMFGPTMDVSNENLKKIDTFLDNNGAFGKTFMYFASAEQPKTPNIDSFLADWGMQVDYSVVGQTNADYLLSSWLGRYAHLQHIEDTEYAGNTYGSTLYTFGSDLRPVKQIWDNGSRGSVETKVLMSTYDGAFLYPLDFSEDEEFLIESAESGVFNDAVMAYRVHSATQELARVAVFGSTQLANDTFMSMSNSNNQDFFINMFNYISGKEASIVVKSKSYSVATFDMNASTANALAIVLCIAVPVAVIVLGIVIWVRRRHR